VERHYVKEKFTEEELRNLLHKIPLEDVLNKKGPYYRGHREELEKLSEDELIVEMAKEPKLIRKPLVITEKDAVAGFNEEKYMQALT
jgi:arsenate reductase-like glutaredoxin family protein